jgi:hypothetical protein
MADNIEDVLCGKRQTRKRTGVGTRERSVVPCAESIKHIIHTRLLPGHLLRKTKVFELMTRPYADDIVPVEGFEAIPGIRLGAWWAVRRLCLPYLSLADCQQKAIMGGLVE